MTRPDEVARIRAEYERRDREIPRGFYSFDRAANLFSLHERERALREALAWLGVLPLQGKKLLEVGCGTGEWFASFERFGLARSDLSGIDLDEGRAAEAREKAPSADIRAGDASRLPWPDQSFDLVFQSTVFSSVLDASLRQGVAAEMLRTLKPGGVVISYDFSFDNPLNHAVKGISARDLRSLFQGCRGRFWRVTLAPPIARRVVPFSWTLAQVMQGIKLLNTHLLAVFQKPGR